MFNSESGIDPLWRLATSLTLEEAAALLAGYDPGHVDTCRNDTDFAQNFSRLYPARSALRGALISGAIEVGNASTADYHHGRMVDDATVSPSKSNDEMNLSNTRVAVSELQTWLRRRGVKSGFFFSNAIDAPGYLDHNHPRYAPKLAAAVRAWEAVGTDPKYLDNGRTVKQNLESWLMAHAAEFDLVKDNREINANAIENQISKVANWEDKGGAPKTP